MTRLSPYTALLGAALLLAATTGVRAGPAVPRDVLERLEADQLSRPEAWDWGTWSYGVEDVPLNADQRRACPRIHGFCVHLGATQW